MNLYVPWLADAARSTGYRVVEIGGWRSRGHGSMRLVEGVVGHHTATPASAAGDYPSLNIVTNGRSDLAGPLCNLGLGRDGTIYIVAAGCGWHAGASTWGGFTDLNDEFLGIEAESPGHGEWTAAQRDCYPKLVGALLKYMSRGPDRYAGHKDVCIPHGRKIDPVGIDTAWLRGQAANFMSGGGGGSSPSGSTGTNGEEPVMIFNYEDTTEVTGYTQETDAAGKVTLKPIRELTTKLIPITLPVGATSAIVSDAWLSVKCAGGGGAIEFLRLMSIRNEHQYGMPGGGYPVDQSFTNVRADKDRPSIKAADGQDQFTVMVRSAVPFSVCVETKQK